jgi:hypothetical protein
MHKFQSTAIGLAVVFILIMPSSALHYALGAL